MRVLFVDHGFHRKTASSGFFVDELRHNGHIVKHLFEPTVTEFERAVQECDCVVLWQQEALAPLAVALGVPTIAVPMYDGTANMPDEYWHHMRGTHLLAFSYTQYLEFLRLELASTYLRYFPVPSPHPRRFQSRDGLLWERTPEGGMDWETVKHWFGPELDSLHIHLAPDGASEKRSVRPIPQSLEFAVTTSRWDRHGRAYRDAFGKANVYFAPRRTEGIGLAFLEAMACGFCVVAFDEPTHNEYMCDGLTGVLVAPDWSNVQIGHELQEAEDRGRAAWEFGQHLRHEWTTIYAPRIAEVVATATRPATDERSTEAAIGFHQAWTSGEAALQKFLAGVADGVSDGGLPAGARQSIKIRIGAAQATALPTRPDGRIQRLILEAGQCADIMIRHEDADARQLVLIGASAPQGNPVRLAIRCGSVAAEVNLGPSEEAALVTSRIAGGPDLHVEVTNAGDCEFAVTRLEAADLDDLSVTQLLRTEFIGIPQAWGLDGVLLVANWLSDSGLALSDVHAAVARSTEFNLDGLAGTQLVEWSAEQVVRGGLTASRLPDWVKGALAQPQGHLGTPQALTDRRSLLSEVLHQYRMRVDGAFARQFSEANERYLAWYYLHGIAEHRLGDLLSEEELRWLSGSEAGDPQRGQHPAPLAVLVSAWRDQDELLQASVAELVSACGADHPGLQVLGHQLEVLDNVETREE